MFGKRNRKAACQENFEHFTDTLSATQPAPSTDDYPHVLPLNKEIAAARMDEAKTLVFNTLIDEIDLGELSKRDKSNLRSEIREVVSEIISAKKLALSSKEQRNLTDDICNDVLGFGPIEPLLQDDTITEIMVNDANTIFVERHGLIEQVDVNFKNNARLMNLCARIANMVGRRVDEASPMCDARLPDGSRVNIVVPPLSIKGPSLTIRKFKRETMTLEALVEMGSLSPECAKLLQAVAASQINVLISGGTGSGKTTLLNALSEHIDDHERLVTIEDTAELQLNQPNVVSMESRRANLEGVGEVSQRELLKNALRMRPDRIILGEVRGPEAIDMLQAMNTGHEGSMGTIHANSPRDAIIRMENMIALGNFGLSDGSVRRQIASAIGLIVQVSRLRDGSRKIVNVSEITGMEGETVSMHELFVFGYDGEDFDGKILGRLSATGIRPHFVDQAAYYNRDTDVLDAVGLA